MFLSGQVRVQTSTQLGYYWVIFIYYFIYLLV